MMWMMDPAARIAVPTSAYQFAPRNSQIMLYASAENNATKFMHMWNVRNKIRNRPVMLITSLRPIDEFRMNKFIKS